MIISHYLISYNGAMSKLCPEPFKLLKRPIDSIGCVRILDKILSIWVKPICLTKDWINKNEVYLLDKIWAQTLI